MSAICVSMWFLSTSLSVLFVAADRRYSGVDLHSHTHPFSLSVSPLPCLSLFPLKRCCDTFTGIIEIQDSIVFGCSHFIGSTNTKLVSPDWDEKSLSRLRTKREKVKTSRKVFVKTLAFSTLVKIISVVILTLSTHTPRRESQDPHRRYHGCCCPSRYGPRT